ncbi:MAG: STAS domain-containing protein [Spirochaetia bacterium]|nr:STAS domain-containing protein [Spirochaetia bacterium]
MLDLKQVGGNVIVSLKGRLDVHLSAEIEKGLLKIIEESPNANIIANMQNVEYMSSSGLRVLVAIMRQLKQKERELRLCGLNQAVRKVFEVVELIDMFNVFDTEEDAIKA